MKRGEGREGPEGFVFSLVSLPVACRGRVAEQNEDPLGFPETRVRLREAEADHPRPRSV